MTVYFNGAFMPREQVSISPDDRGFTFGDGVYEVVCAYEGEPFELGRHQERLARSLCELGIAGPQNVEVGEVLQELLRRNGLEERHAKLYLQITRGAAPRAHSFPEPSVPPTVYVTAVPYEPPEKKWAEGVAVILHPDLRWARCDIKSTALLPNVLASQRAKEQGAFEAVLVREGVVTEGSHTTVLGIFDGTVVTHPKGPHLLPGVTRDVVLELCADLGLPVEEMPIEEERLRGADELVLLGTTTGVMPVMRVEKAPVGDGAPGPVTRKLQRAFRDTANL